jgi:hypothetical protein
MTPIIAGLIAAVTAATIPQPPGYESGTPVEFYGTVQAVHVHIGGLLLYPHQEVNPFDALPDPHRDGIPFWTAADASGGLRVAVLRIYANARR